ncbi:MAG: spore germination protein GerW family protein [Methanoregula sp.]
MLRETALELEKIIASKNVIGAPVDIGDKTVIPLSRFGFGFGAGGAHMNQSGGEGSGAGGGIEPIALIVVHKDVRGLEGIKVLSLRWNPVNQVVETLSESLAPQIVEAIKAVTGAPEEEKGEESIAGITSDSETKKSKTSKSRK